MIKPRSWSGSLNYAIASLTTREIWLQAEKHVLTSMLEHLEEEHGQLLLYKDNRMDFELRLAQFLDGQVEQRRQRSLQREINDRKLRLKELRNVRLEMLIEQQKKEEEAKEEELKKKKRKAERKSESSKVFLSIYVDCLNPVMLYDYFGFFYLLNRIFKLVCLLLLDFYESLLLY